MFNRHLLGCDAQPPLLIGMNHALKTIENRSLMMIFGS